MRITLFKHSAIVVSLILASWGLLFSVSAQPPLQENTPSASSTSTPTQVPLPELPQTLSDLQSLFQKTNEACHLPCFWSIRPGYTTETEIVSFLQSNALFSNVPEREYDFRESPEKSPFLVLSFDSTDNVVSTTTMIVRNPSTWLPAETLELPYLLSTMPSMPAAYIGINITTFQMFLILIYKEGVWARYTFELHEAGESIKSI